MDQSGVHVNRTTRSPINDPKRRRGDLIVRLVYRANRRGPEARSPRKGCEQPGESVALEYTNRRVALGTAGGVDTPRWLWSGKVARGDPRAPPIPLLYSSVKMLCRTVERVISPYSPKSTGDGSGKDELARRNCAERGLYSKGEGSTN